MQKEIQQIQLTKGIALVLDNTVNSIKKQMGSNRFSLGNYVEQAFETQFIQFRSRFRGIFKRCIVCIVNLSGIHFA